MVEVKGLTKMFGGFAAVDGVSFSVKPGEIYGLLGETGAGKTTTLRMLATVLVPTSGSATIFGADVVRSQEEARSRIGVLSGEGGVYDRLSATENVVYFGRLHGLPEGTIRARTRVLLEDLGMAEYGSQRAGSFSRGMKQKVAIARSVVHDPPVLLFDEPTSGLDVTAARVVHEFLLGERLRGKAIILSSHVMAEVEKLCDRVGVIHRGRLVAEGTVRDLMARSTAESMEEVFVGLVGEGA